MTPELSAEAPAAARPREMWPTATLGTMLLLIAMLCVQLATVSAATRPQPDATYADGGSIASRSVLPLAAGLD